MDNVSEGRPEEEDNNNNRSPLDEGYWDRLGEHDKFNTKKEETVGSEVVEITFARDIEKPPEIGASKDSDAVKNESESIVVWT